MKLMKLQLNKKKLKNLSKDAQILPNDMTPNVAGGMYTDDCNVLTTKCQNNPSLDSCGCASAGKHTAICCDSNTCW